MRPIGTLLLLAVLGTPVAAATPALPAAKPHDPPPVFLDFDVKDDRLIYVLLLWGELYEEWVGLRWQDVEADPAAVVERDGRRIVDWVMAKGPVLIDGIAVRPILDGVETHVNDVRNVTLTMHVPLLTPPRSVEVAWLQYEGREFALYEVKSFFWHGDDLEPLSFTAEEPGYVWHAPAPAADAAATPSSPLADVWELPRRPTLPIPTVSLAILLLCGVTSTLAWRRGWSRPLIGVLVLGSLGAAWVTRDVAAIEVAIGKAPAPEIPDAEEAKRIFSALHANVYRAFDYDDPDAIYDALSRSVTDELLERIYGEIYRGLILQEEGGAVARAQAVRIQELELSSPPDDDREARFDVTCRWMVRGVVEHFGHRHLRTIEYHARFAVVRRDGRWRIADMETLAQRRVSEDE